MGYRVTGNRKSAIEDDVVSRGQAKRHIEKLKGGPKRKIANKREPAKTVACSFSLTPELDAMIEQIADDWGCSRSRVVRQILLLYGANEK